MSKPFSEIRQTAQQLLRDEFTGEGTSEFAPDELDIYINECLIEISQRSPYEVKETVVSDGTINISLTAITNLIGDRVVEVEYPTGSSPQSFIRDFKLFGTVLTLADAPASGANVYLYCHKVHSLTESASSLTPELEKTLVDGVVAKAARAFLNKMRDQIVPASISKYQAWANDQFRIYQNSLNSITRPRAWEY
jgi:hypothetical protein